MLAIRNLDHAVELLHAYHHGVRSAADERQRLLAAKELSAAEYRQLGEERYYEKTELLKYELLRWHLQSTRWLVDLRFVRHFKPGTVLDFGAGIGLSAMTYAASGFDVIAVELSLDSDLVRFGTFLLERLGIDNVRFVDRLPPGTVDNVTCIETFEHFRDWTGPARELVSLLRPGGTMVISATFEEPDEDPDHPYHYPSPVEPQAFLRSLGLEPIKPNIWRKATG